MDKRDYYDVLGVPKSATEDDIKKAYRTLAKKYHPDVSTEANAEAKFKEVQEAYENLSDSQKRSQYDQFGHQGPSPFGQGGFSGGQGGFGGFDFGDIFSSFFGGQSAGQQTSGNARSRPRKGSDIQRSMKISFEESIFGKKEKIKLQVYDECPACHGSGAKSPNDVHTCSKCQGTGTINVRQQTIFGVQQSRVTCDRCGGTGKEITAKCLSCGGEGNVRVTKDVEVRVPEGIETGQQIRLEGFGNKGGSGGPNGDLYIVFEVLEHNVYVREGDDILIKVPISFSQATLGADLEIPTVYGDVLLKIPAGTQSGARFVVRGKGAPNVRTKVKGDEHVIVHLATPTRITPEQKKLFEELSRLDDGGKKSTQWDKFKENFKK